MLNVLFSGFLVFFGLTYLFYYYLAYFTNLSEPIRLLNSPHSTERNVRKNVMQMKATKKFIVITSVVYPTEDIKALAANDEWTVVVVGDTKTPSDWKYPNVHFLSLEVQRELGYSIFDHVPFKSYTRKMIGYLYAIERGAEWIYDTDDDNKPYGKGLAIFDYAPQISGLVYTANNHFRNETSERLRLFQPYSFFGRPDIWPRGFPLEYIKKQKNMDDHYSLCQHIKTPVIQQGIVKKDPDVDAIYRLINADPISGLEEEFSLFAPAIVIGADVYSPFNSQNTLFHRSAFFTLWLPVSVSFRVTDIWRSYFAQKLIHLIGENIAFYPMNAIQNRNAHNYLSDFKEEKSLYEDAGRIVEYLNKWKCSLKSTVDCLLDLAESFSLNGFWNKTDAELASLWVKDLIKLNYSFPPLDYKKGQYEIELNETIRQVNCRRSNLELLHKPVEMSKKEQFAINSYRELDKWCGTDNFSNYTAETYPFPDRLVESHANSMLNKYQNIALIITDNFDFQGTISLLQRIYEPYFALTIYCGPFYKEKLIDSNNHFPKLRFPINYIHIPQSQMQNGYYGYYCATKAIELRLQNVIGFIVLSDDAVFNLWNSFPLDKFVARVHGKLSTSHWYNLEIGLPALNRTVEILDRRYKNDEKVQKILQAYTKNAGMPYRDHLRSKYGHGWLDFYFLPANETTLFAFKILSEAMFEAQVFHELALSKIAVAIEFYGNYSFYYAWYEPQEREHWERKYNHTHIAFHPVKLSQTNDDDYRARVCKHYFGTFKEHLFH